jgi:hypothetical protein
MKFTGRALTLLAALAMTVVCGAQTDPMPEAATPAMLKAFQSHDIVMLGDMHGSKQQHDWLARWSPHARGS